MTSVAILGCGNWGSTLAVKLAGRGHEVRVWEFDPSRAERIERDRVNEDFLPGVPFPEGIRVSADASSVVEGASVVLLVLPTPAVRSAVGLVAPVLAPDCVLVSASKGIEYETGYRITEVAAEALGSRRVPLAALSGPNLAWEVVRDHPSSAVVASVDASAARRVQELVASPTYRVYTSSDVVGVELGGALKNVIAIAAGVVNGLGFGDNTKAALMTRGLAEITRYGIFRGANPLTFQGLSGLGDLVATCASTLSRNHQAGRMVAEGLGVDEIRGRMKMVAEGINTTRAIHPLAIAAGVGMPITAALHGVLFGGADVRRAIEGLMTRDLRSEDEFASLAIPPRP